MISFRGLGDPREFVVLLPVEFAAVDNNTSDGGSVTANPFGCAVHDDVGAMVDGTDEVSTNAECVVNDERDTVIVRDFGKGGEVTDGVFGVGDALDVDGLGLLIDGGSEGLGFFVGNELDSNAELLEGDFELIKSSAI